MEFRHDETITQFTPILSPTSLIINYSEVSDRWRKWPSWKYRIYYACPRRARWRIHRAPSSFYISLAPGLDDAADLSFASRNLDIPPLRISLSQRKTGKALSLKETRKINTRQVGARKVRAPHVKTEGFDRLVVVVVVVGHRPDYACSRRFVNLEMLLGGSSREGARRSWRDRPGHSPRNQIYTHCTSTQAQAVWSRSSERDKTRTRRTRPSAFFNGRCADPRCILLASRLRGKRESRGGGETLRSLSVARVLWIPEAKVPEAFSALERFGVSAIIVVQ
ncbi:hypothetical protein DBV15_03666 [Temnothorax longispinosus]|uniref:Uncharacterized protein n=1 Tax=Temnothorax longispinosus TaxID=300112 RepID=A0A4V3S9V9_9HYME|nr:hypothetical protein DBV15_03666 [Temnothorax longispinosus]